MSGAAGAGASFLGFSATAASVVISRAATEAASCSAMRVTGCATVEIENCTADQAHIELNVCSMHAEEDVSPRLRSSARMVVTKGQSGSIDTSIGEGLRFDAVVTPMD